MTFCKDTAVELLTFKRYYHRIKNITQGTTTLLEVKLCKVLSLN